MPDSTKEQAKRGNSGRFAKGTSGNPGGHSTGAITAEGKAHQLEGYRRWHLEKGNAASQLQIKAKPCF